MSRKKYPRKPIACSRVTCQQFAITKVFHDGKWHAVCKACWQTHMDQQDKLAPKPAPAVDYKRLAAGDA